MASVRCGALSCWTFGAQLSAACNMVNGRQRARCLPAPNGTDALPFWDMPRSRNTSPLCRRAALHGYLHVAQELGIDAERILRAHGLAPNALEPDAWAPVDDVAGVLGSSFEASGREDVAMLLAQRRRFSTLGPLSLLLHEEPDVDRALALLHKSVASYNQALSFYPAHGERLTFLGVTLAMGDDVDEMSARQALELSIAAYHSVVRELFEPGWRAVEVHFPHPAPRDQSTHHSVFGTTLVWNADGAAVVVRRDDLKHELQQDLQRGEYARRFLASLALDLHDASTTAAVRNLIQTRMASGGCTADVVARDMVMDRRTLHRHLEREGTTFKLVFDDTRAATAEEHLRHSGRTVAQVSDALGFAAPSAMTRWFTRRYGCTPTEWREQRAGSDEA